MGPEASRGMHALGNAPRGPGLIHQPTVARRKVAPSHDAVTGHPVRHTEDHPAPSSVRCRSVPSNAPAPSTTTDAPRGINSCPCATSAIWRSSGKCPFFPWRPRHASGRARPF